MNQDSPTSSKKAEIKTVVKREEYKLRNSKKRKTKPKAGRLQFKNKFKRVLHGKYNDLGLTHNAKCILNSMVNDIFDRLTVQAIHLQRTAKRNTLTHHDMASACSLLLTGNLQSYAKAAATKAVVQYLRSYKK